MSSRKRKTSAKRKRSDWKKRRIKSLICSFLIGFGIFAAVIYGVLHHSVHKIPEDQIAGNVYIGEVNVSGMTKKEAVTALENKINEYKEQTLTVEIGDKSVDILLKDMGFGVKSADKTVDKALGFGKKGSLWKQFRDVRSLKKEKKVIDEEFVLNKEAAEKILTEQVVPHEQAAVDATIKKTDKGFAITDEASGKKLSIEKSIKTIEKYLNKKWNYKSAVVKLVEESQKPRVTRADLETIEDRLGSFYTDAGGGGRVKNLQRAAELINGTILMPGEEFSVEKATAPYTEENGYVSASAYENGQVVQNMAGGLCQVSTTLYNAVLYSELKVTLRSAHSLIVKYVEPSRDAAIAEGLKDFKFVNSYDTPIFIEGFIDSSNRLLFNIYGKDTRPENREVKFESETLEVTPITTKYVEDKEKEIGYFQKEGSAFEGRKARLWKVVYEDGKEVSRDVINNSTYNTSDRVIKVGTASPNAEASKAVKNSIASQDETTIKNAIGEADRIIKNAGKEEKKEEVKEENTPEEE